jgi:hypothetical protein
MVMPLLERIPDYADFPTVDEMVAAVHRLHERHPEITQLRRVGSSRLGEPLHCLTIGSGARQALVFAMPHPNEPIGALTAVELARQLCEDAALLGSLNVAWHIVPCIDPDGTRLNEGWFKGPFTRSHYARHFYRPATEDQVEWTFPFSYKQAYFDGVLPETLALMRLIDELKPDFLCSLHNAETGGVYYYLSRPAPALYPVLHAIPEQLGLPLDRGEPEAAYAPLFAPAIFGQISRERAYDYLEQAGQDPVDGIYGESSSHYASRYGTFSLVSELPYWADDAADDETPTDEPYPEVLRRQADGEAEVVAAMREALATAGDELTLETPFLRASKCFVETLERGARLTRWRAEQPDADRPATRAEQVSSRELVHMYRTRFPGMLVRALAAQIDAGLASPRVRAAHAALEAHFESWCEQADADTPPAMLPIKKLVATQLGAIIAACHYLEHEDRDGG